mgnify:CR=1 FL=1|jgi:site-specific recombinase XerD
MKTELNEPKFYLFKNKRYQKYYVLTSRYNPETKKNKLAYKSLKTGNKQEAIIKFNKFVNEYNQQSEVKQLNRNITFTEFFQEITPSLNANLAKNTINIYNLAVRKFIEIVGNKVLRLIDMNDIENFKVKRLQQDVSKFEVNKELSCIKALFNIAIRMEYLNKNACRYVKKYIAESNKRKIFTEDEIQLLLANIKDNTLLNIVKFGILSGLRLNEILHIKLSDINLQTAEIKVYQDKTKKNKICFISNKLSELLVELLNEFNEGNNIIDITKTNDRYLFTVFNREPVNNFVFLFGCI